jgi:hypothetical protein
MFFNVYTLLIFNDLFYFILHVLLFIKLLFGKFEGFVV